MVIPLCGYVSAGLCPVCHQPYIVGDLGVECPFCGWTPAQLADEADE